MKMKHIIAMIICVFLALGILLIPITGLMGLESL